MNVEKEHYERFKAAVGEIMDVTHLTIAGNRLLEGFVSLTRAEQIAFLDRGKEAIAALRMEKMKATGIPTADDVQLRTAAQPSRNQASSRGKKK